MHTITLSATQASRLDLLVATGSFTSTEEAAQLLLDEILAATELSAYSPDTLAHLHRGMEEAEAGQFVCAEEMQGFVEDWRRNG